MIRKINNNGFTFLTAIFMVMILGIMLGMSNQVWSTIMKRERERELIFRGNQVKEGIENWYNKDYPPGKGHVVHALTELKHLTESPFSLEHEAYVRPSALVDPITRKEWVPVKALEQPQSSSKGGASVLPLQAMGAAIVGVRSSSDDKPLKTDFKDIPTLQYMTKNIDPKIKDPILKDINDKFDSGTKTEPKSDEKKYSDWRFAYDSFNASVVEHAKTYNSFREPGY